MVRIFIKCLTFECNYTTHLAGNCVKYGVQGTEFCADCGAPQQKFNSSCYFCKDRRHHHLVSRYPYNDVDDPGRLRLLSVLCIETSHYVCFLECKGLVETSGCFLIVWMKDQVGGYICYDM